MADTLHFGAAYYAEYMPADYKPEERIEEDFALMEQAGFNLIRVAESTWSSWEPQDGVFDFSQLERVLQAAGRHGLDVIVGTPTYAIPPWLAKKYPDILALTHDGQALYGHRQNMDITHPGYRQHAERIIRHLCEVSKNYPCVIGYQLDNETKPYDTCGPRAQAGFVRWLKEKYGTVQALNNEMGLAYWSNSIGSWEDLPDVRGTINGSLGAEFEAYQRSLVTEFFAWQSAIVREYLRPGQFLTHNFDSGWKGYSYGLQPEVDQFEAAKPLDVAGTDIYHPTGAKLTGAEISFAGDVARGIKSGKNYLVLETQAQGSTGHLAYPGQLTLHLYSHLAAGATTVEYWHWHSIHNSAESYWKGVLSHDMQPGAAYREIAETVNKLRSLAPRLEGMQKHNRVAVMVSNRSQAGFKWFPAGPMFDPPQKDYNDFLRRMYDAFYRMGIETDIIWDSCRDFSGYDLVALPSVYAMPEDLSDALKSYVSEGGCLVAGPRTGFADEALKIYHDAQPHGLTQVFGITYDEFTLPDDVQLAGVGADLPAGAAALTWMELLHKVPCGNPMVLARYAHPAWGEYTAAALNRYGKGAAAYLGCDCSDETMEALLKPVLAAAGIPLPPCHWPLVQKQGVNGQGKRLCYCLNYSAWPQRCVVPFAAEDLLTGSRYEAEDALTLAPWGAAVLEEVHNG